MEKRPLMTTQEAADYIGVKISYLRKLMMRHAISFFKPNGKLCYFAQEDLDRWMRRVRIPAQEEIDAEAAAYITRKDALG